MFHAFASFPWTFLLPDAVTRASLRCIACRRQPRAAAICAAVNRTGVVAGGFMAALRVVSGV